MRRKPAVAGYFYPADSRELLAVVEELIREAEAGEKKEAIAVVSPHAGYIYSGRVAAKVYSAVEPPDVAVLLGPNHTGAGAKAAIMTEGMWDTPVGSAEIDTELALSILERSQVLVDDFRAHMMEHSLEVQLPFLQYLNPAVRIVPMVFFPLSHQEIMDVAASIAEAVREREGRVLIVASTDMSHYVPADVAAEKDRKAIEKILELNGLGLVDVVREYDISMCGYIPTAIAVEAARLLGAKRAELVAYSNSGEVSGDPIVVGYAGVIIY